VDETNDDEDTTTTTTMSNVTERNEAPEWRDIASLIRSYMFLQHKYK